MLCVWRLAVAGLVPDITSIFVNFDNIWSFLMPHAVDRMDNVTELSGEGTDRKLLQLINCSDNTGR